MVILGGRVFLMSEVPLYRVRFRRPICSREFLCSENFSMQIGRRTRTRQAHLGCLVVGVAEAAESSTFIHATGYEPHRSVRTDRALGVVQTHQPSGWDQIPIFEALELYWTSPESGAPVVQINGLEKDEMVLL